MDLGMPTLIELPELADCGALCQELGLQFVELNMNLPQYQTKRISPEKFRETAERYGIYYTLHLDENLNVSDFNPHVAGAWMRTVEESIGLAKELRIPVLNMHLSRGVYFTMPEKKIFLFDVYRERYLADMRAFRERCASEIGTADIKVCVENSDGYTDFQVQALDLLLESSVFGLTYDIGHNHSLGGSDEPVILQREERLTHFHFHDGIGRKNHLPLGTGEIDMQKYYNLAKAHNSRIVLETKTIQGLKQSVKWFRQQFGIPNKQNRAEDSQ
ncbi:MAG: sugar phosphate isomerase/epimerase [Oscillospiraceae bacterium]|nr:sugar phosphate isomerase/epimerase [Oscillospiraceae bacterium]